MIKDVNLAGSLATQAVQSGTQSGRALSPLNKPTNETTKHHVIVTPLGAWMSRRCNVLNRDGLAWAKRRNGRIERSFSGMEKPPKA